MSRDKRDAERAARRAKRLAERAQERASRKEQQAQEAAERAERLAQRVNRRSGREKNLERSIEDIVDEVTVKAEAWLNEQTNRLLDTDDPDQEIKRATESAERARKAAERARASAERAERAAEDLSDVEQSFVDDAERAQAAHARRYGYGRTSSHHRSRTRSAHLYRDKQNKRFLGVCAGLADYFGRPTWQVRLLTVLGLIFVPSLVFPTYFILYFLMEDKPYYRRFTDSVEELVDNEARSFDTGDRTQTERSMNAKGTRSRKDTGSMSMNNEQAMKIAKGKFSDIEQRLRQMETHVTSSRFELQRELKKISGED